MLYSVCLFPQARPKTLYYCSYIHSSRQSIVIDCKKLIYVTIITYYKIPACFILAVGVTF